VLNWKDCLLKTQGIGKNLVVYVVTADVKAIYPTVNNSLEGAMERHAIFNIKFQKIIAELNKICHNDQKKMEL